jgi:SGNH domain (fused to AT3 domains)
MIGSLLAYYRMSEDKVKSRIFFKKIFFFKETNKKNFIIVNLQSTVGITAIMIAISITNQKYFPGYWPLLPTLGAALIINSEKSYINQKILSNRLLVLIGLISYPLYLWHWTLFSFVKIIYNETLSTEIRIVLILISFLFSVLTFYLIEKPARSIILRFKYLILIITIIFIGVFGYIIFKYNGFESRLPKIISELIRYNENPTKEFYRAGSCFLNEDQDFIIFNNCVESVSLSKKTILLWGDSHAAHLYPGYKKYYENNFNIRQRTASGCPPIINYDVNLTTSKLERQFCRTINYHIIDELKELQPEIVVLSADWTLYDSKKIYDSIIELKKIDRIKKIYLIGAGPHWKNDLPKDLFLFWKKSLTVPFRMNYGLELKKSIDINLILEEIAKNTNITFISPIKILCDKDGCITRLDNSSDSLIIWDSAHLTVKGSEYLVSKFFLVK